MCATWRSCVTCGTCPLCIIFYKFGHRMPVPGRFAGCHRTSDAGSGRFAGCHRTPVCRMSSDAGSSNTAGRRFTAGRRMPAPAGLPDAIEHREPVPAGSPDAAGRRMPVRRYTAGRRMPSAGCHRYRSLSDAGPPVATGTHHRRMPGRRSPPVPVTIGCRATGPVRRRRRSGAGCFVPPVQFWFVKNLYMWLGNLHF